MKKKEIDGIMENKTLLNILSPIGGIEYKKNYIRVGDYLGRVYVITKYPQKVRVGWLENIANIPNTVCCLNISPTEKDTLMQNISRGIKQNESQYEGITDEILRQRTEREIQDARDLIEKVDLNGETVVYVTIAIMVIAEDEEELKQRSKAVLTRLTSMQMKGRLLTNLSKNSLKLMSPFSITDPVVKSIADRNMLESTWIGGLPFSSSGFNDGNKYYFARDTKGGIVILDPWKRGGDRTNSNFVIMGTAGVGKSTVAKHLILNEYMTNTKVILIDPEREEKEMVEKLGEKWIDVGSGKGGIINPLQIKKVPLDDEEADEVEYKSKGMGAMALHFQTLITFFKLLYPELDSIHIARLEEVLEELYNRFNIYWDTDISGIPNNKFPIMTDLYNLLGEKASNEIDEEKQSTMDFHHQLKGAILDAVDEGIIDRDPTRKAIIKGKTPKEKKIKYLNQFELHKLIADLNLGNKLNYDWLILLIAKTGMRFSEALAITPRDFDFPHQMLSISKTWNYKGEGGFMPTKNASSVRKVQLDWQTVIQFSELIKDLPEDKPIFISNKVYNSTINDILEKHCKNVEVPIISIHGLRHTHASILLFAGVSIASVAHRLGHSSMTTTQKTYLHIIQELENTDIDLIMRSLTALNS